MKKFFSLLLSVFLLSGGVFFCTSEPIITQIQAAARDITLTLQIDNPIMMVNGEHKPVDAQGSKPLMIKGKTMVPLRGVVEELGGEVQWNGEERKAILTHYGQTLELTIDSTEALYNDKPTELETAPVLVNGKSLVPIRFIAEHFGYEVYWNALNQSVILTNTGSPNGGILIVLDAGHGKVSSAMNDQEMINNGWLWDSLSRTWGDWHHWKYGTNYPDCQGEGCSHWGDCWYWAVKGDRYTEPEINLNNTKAAKKYLEQMGYLVRMTRTSNEENPSLTKRIADCYYQQDLQSTPDASCFVCLHSNAGGGSGSAYIALDGYYDQPTLLGSSKQYIDKGNLLGSLINDRIVSSVDLPRQKPITFEPNLIMFNKCPITCGYLEIGFFDNGYDLAILNTQYDQIGHAVAQGIDDFMKSGVISGTGLESSGCPSASFQDVDTELSIHYPIDYVVKKGLMSGTSPETFAPFEQLDRASAAMVLYRMEGSPEILKQAEFADVPDNAWYGKAISWANSHEIITGYEDGSFGPSHPITKEQMITILYRYAKYKGYDCDLYNNINLNAVDASAISPYALSAMKWAYGHGIAEIAEDTLNPQAPLTRLEMAAMLMRFARLPQPLA